MERLRLFFAIGKMHETAVVNGIDFYHLGKLETQYKMNERSYCHVRSISTKA